VDVEVVRGPRAVEHLGLGARVAFLYHPSGWSTRPATAGACELEGSPHSRVSRS
jgi:hypothetical protein